MKRNGLRNFSVIFSGLHTFCDVMLSILRVSNTDTDPRSEANRQAL